MIEYQIKLINFPKGKTKEAVTQNEDGTYTIFIDASLSHENQQKRFLHAMKHICGNDFCRADVEGIELEAHITN